MASALLGNKKTMRNVPCGATEPWNNTPESWSSYTCQLKLYFSCGNKEKFFQVMQELRKLDITIDNETLELIRTFM